MELGVEEGEDAPSDDDIAENSVVMENEANLLEVQPSAKEVSSDGASATPMKTILPADLTIPDQTRGAP